MESLIAQLTSKIDDINIQISTNNNIITYSNNKKFINILSNIEQKLRIVYTKTCNILKICINKYNTKTKQYSNNKVINNNIPIKLESSKPLNDTINTSLAPGIPIHINTLNSIDELPNFPIYWINDIKQFAVKINNVVLRGNIGNIYNKIAIHENKNVNQTVPCKNGNKCYTLFSKNICKFYHDPIDLLKLVHNDTLSADTYNLYTNLKRNFINTSWLYTNLPYNKKNIMMRHFGSRNILCDEFDLLNNQELNNIYISNYKQQTMHDILVLLAMNNNLNECVIGM